jgi:hypothetical protein
MEVLVFTTSVQSSDQVRSLAPFIDSLAGKNRWNFALDDQDKILRIVSDKVKPMAAIHLLQQNGYRCQELSD